MIHLMSPAVSVPAMSSVVIPEPEPEPEPETTHCPGAGDVIRRMFVYLVETAPAPKFRVGATWALTRKHFIAMFQKNHCSVANAVHTPTCICVPPSQEEKVCCHNMTSVPRRLCLNPNGTTSSIRMALLYRYYRAPKPFWPEQDLQFIAEGCQFAPMTVRLSPKLQVRYMLNAVLCALAKLHLRTRMTYVRSLRAMFPESWALLQNMHLWTMKDVPDVAGMLLTLIRRLPRGPRTLLPPVHHPYHGHIATTGIQAQCSSKFHHPEFATLHVVTGECGVRPEHMNTYLNRVGGDESWTERCKPPDTTTRDFWATCSAPNPWPFPINTSRMPPSSCSRTTLSMSMRR